MAQQALTMQSLGTPVNPLSGKTVPAAFSHSLRAQKPSFGKLRTVAVASQNEVRMQSLSVVPDTYFAHVIVVTDVCASCNVA